jgi:S1-C subfamily serine protease
VILESFTATGRDIYNQGNTKRSVYSLKADVRQGNSGGPLITTDGTVAGVIFAESTTYEDVGYALTMEQVLTALNQAKDRTQSVATGSCAQ